SGGADGVGVLIHEHRHLLDAELLGHAGQGDDAVLGALVAGDGGPRPVGPAAAGAGRDVVGLDLADQVLVGGAQHIRIQRDHDAVLGVRVDVGGAAAVHE